MYNSCYKKYNNLLMYLQKNNSCETQEGMDFSQEEL